MSTKVTIHPETPAHPRQGRGKTSFLWAFSLIIMSGAALGFGGKIFEFLRTWHEIPEAKFALIPVALYFCTAVGFMCLFLYAVMHGMLSDIEGPKYRMLEEAEELEQREAKERGRPAHAYEDEV